MHLPQAPFWTPSPDVIARAHATRLGAGLGLADFTALHAFSLREPEAYWRHVMREFGVRWSRPWQAYADLSEGAPFPRWFTGGELNWTDTIFAFAEDPAQRDRAAVVTETEDGARSTVSFAGLQQRVARFAAGLSAIGISRGDRVGMLMEPGIEAVVTLLAISWIGAIAVPLFSGFGTDAVTARLSSCGATALIATSGFHRRGRWVDIAAVVRASRARLPELRTLCLKRRPNDGATIDGAAVDGAVDWHHLAAHAPGAPAARMDPNDPMMIVYTSGTTGKPKGAVHTHGGFPIKIVHDSAVHFDVGPGDVWFWAADMGWIAGPLTMAAALMRGATFVCYDGAPDFPDWSRMSRLIEAHNVTHFGASPTLVRGLASNQSLAARGATETVRVLITAGEVIDPEHMLWFHNVIGRGICPVINYTGGTEVSGSLLANVIVRPIVAAGFNAISPGVDVDVLDDAGHPVRDSVGELAIRQPFVGMTQAFWQDRERYLETYWQQIPGTWIHGDLAMRRSDGVFFLLGRSDDTLKVAGKRLGPAEVEDVLLILPEIGDVAAIGVEDAAKGQRLIVFVIPAPGVTRAPEELQQLVSRTVADRLGKPFQPARVHIVEQLPRTRSQKIMRRVIRRVYTGVDPGDLSALDNPASLAEVRAAAGS